MRTRRSFATLRKATSNVSLVGDSASVGTNYSAAKLWRFHRHFASRSNGTEISPVRRTYRKRDRFKAVFTGWGTRYLVYKMM